jgi:hypothetical protein
MLVRAGYVMGVLLLISGFVHLAILIINGGSWYGPLSFRKPATFGLSFGLTLVTIVWVTGFLKLGTHARSVLLTAFTAASVLETTLVSLQAWRGVPSHFNVETGFDAWVARGLAGGGAALVGMIVVLTVAAFRTNSDVPLSLRIAIRTGFLALCAAMAVGDVMIVRGMRLVFAGDPQTAYLTGGALKPIHAVTMHGILVLPVLASLMSFTDWTEQRRVKVVVAAACGYGLLVAMVTIGTVAGLL